MGAKLVKQAYLWASTHPVSDRAQRLLAYMCLVALDSDLGPDRPARLYFESWEASAVALGSIVPDTAIDDESARVRTNAYERVKSARRELVNLGAIALIGRAKPGRTAEYEIRVSVDIGDLGKP